MVKYNGYFPYKLIRIIRAIPGALYDGMRLLLALVISCFAKILCGKSGIWLIGERYDEARDNGFHFFNYIKKANPNIKIFYVLSPDSPDFGRVSKIGSIIHWNSFKHFLYWCLADCIISAHDGKLAPGGPLCYKLAKKGFNNSKSFFYGME